MGNKLLYVGNLIPMKGVSSLLEAHRAVIRQFPSSILTIVGSGWQKTELKELARTMGIDRQVQFLGRIPNDELPLIMHESDLFVLPSLSEATPRAIMEAMAMELPVVATRVGGIPEMVDDGRGIFP